MKNIKFAVIAICASSLLMAITTIVGAFFAPEFFLGYSTISIINSALISVVAIFFTLKIMVKNLALKNSIENIRQGLVTTWQGQIIVSALFGLSSFLKRDHVLVSMSLLGVSVVATYISCQYFIKQLSKSEHLNVPKVN